MNIEFELTPYPSGGGQLKVKGNLTVKNSALFKHHLLELLHGNGNFLISLRDVDELDITAIQLLWALRQSFLSAKRRVTITWPQNEAIKQLFGKAGLLQSMQK